MAPGKQLRVLLVDDHAIVREGLQEVLERSGDIEVVGQAADGVEALRCAEDLKPDVVVMDVMMPNMDGVEACRELASMLPDTRVLMLTASTRDDVILDAVAAGAAGFLQKFSGRDELVAAVREVAEGRSRIPVDMVRRAFDVMRDKPEQQVTGPPRTLTERERRVLTLFAQGNSYAQVAEVVGNSPITVRNSIYRIEAKLGVKTKQEIVVWAVRHGLLNGDPPAD